MRFNSLKTRILLWFTAVTSVILILFSLSFYYFLNSSIKDNIQTRLRHQAMEIEQNYDDKNNTSNTFAIIDDNSILYKTSDFDLKNLDFYLKSGQSFFILNSEQSDETINALYIYQGKKHKIAVYKKDIDNKIEDLVDNLLILNPILLLLLVFLASKMIDKILDPINNLIKTTRDISVSNFSKTVPMPKEEDEIRELVNSFNEMIKRLQGGVASLDRFNSDVSHELKTPLTVILGEIEVTLRKSREADMYEKSMKTIQSQAQQMQKIVENLLLLTRYTKENIAESFEECSLDEILLQTIDKYSAQLKAKNIALHVSKIEPVRMMANPLLIGLIFSNLIDNAIKYSSENRNIYLSLYKQNGMVFEIKDEGIGIPKEQIAKITDRFYRVDESRNKKIEGFGLGLFIVKQSVELHNGKMEIDSSLGEGTTIEVIL